MIKSKQVMKVTAIIIILLGILVYCLFLLMPKSTTSLKSSIEVASKSAPAPSPVKYETPAQAVESPEAKEVFSQPTSFQTSVVEAPEQPKVLSTQEYGDMYLDLTSHYMHQVCFDAIISHFPDRFTPEVREANVKSLRIWASPCSTGVLSYTDNSQRVPLIETYGPNGGYFDSPLAKSQQY